jgi:hypothetical protein
MCLVIGPMSDKKKRIFLEPAKKSEDLESDVEDCIDLDYDQLSHASWDSFFQETLQSRPTSSKVTARKQPMKHTDFRAQLKMATQLNGIDFRQPSPQMLPIIQRKINGNVYSRFMVRNE